MTTTCSQNEQCAKSMLITGHYRVIKNPIEEENR